MLYKYHVYHDYAATAALLPPMDDVREEHEYSCFPGTLAIRITEPGIFASSVPAQDRKGVVATLELDGSEEEARNVLARCLIAQNKAIAGLCLVGEFEA